MKFHARKLVGVFHARTVTGAVLSLTSLCLATLLTGCVVVGRSSRGGLFIWPGGLGLIVLVLVLLLVLRRR